MNAYPPLLTTPIDKLLPGLPILEGPRWMEKKVQRLILLLWQVVDGK